MPSRDEEEETLFRVVADVVKAFLARVKKTPDATLGQMNVWWAALIDERVVPVLQETWARAAGGTDVTATAGYIALVRNRLVDGSDTDVPDDTFRAVQSAVATGQLLGWSVRQISAAIAVHLSWTTQHDYWKKQRQTANDTLDVLLDRYGPPGSPSREAAKTADPDVVSLLDLRSTANSALDQDASSWESRAVRIARTESTAAWNSGSTVALANEGWTHKQWLATPGPRTRPAHRTADGQLRELTLPFSVGGELLQFPGDPLATPAQRFNCRCTLLGSEG